MKGLETSAKEINLSKEANIIPQYDIMVISVGDYSDYEILIMAKTLREINPKEIETQYLEKYPEQQHDFNKSMLIQWLIDEKFIEEMILHELHLGYSLNIDFISRTQKQYKQDEFLNRPYK